MTICVHAVQNPESTQLSFSHIFGEIKNHVTNASTLQKDLSCVAMAMNNAEMTPKN